MVVFANSSAISFPSFNSNPTGLGIQLSYPILSYHKTLFLRKKLERQMVHCFIESLLINKGLGYMCLVVFPDELENGWTDFDHSFFYLLTMDPY